jgi:hypothetical protein
MRKGNYVAWFGNISKPLFICQHMQSQYHCPIQGYLYIRELGSKRKKSTLKQCTCSTSKT